MLKENQSNLVKGVKSFDENQLEIFSTQDAQSDNVVTPRHYVSYRDARKSLKIYARNQFKPLENKIE